MRWRKVIRRNLDHEDDGVNVAGAVNAVVAGSVNESGASHTSVSSKQRIVQRNGRTVVNEHEVDVSDDEGRERR